MKPDAGPYPLYFPSSSTFLTASMTSSAGWRFPNVVGSPVMITRRIIKFDLFYKHVTNRVIGL